MTGEIKPQIVPCSIIFASVVFCNGFVCIYTLLLPELKTRGHEDHTTRNAVPINSQLALLWPFQIALNADGVYNIWGTATSERVFYYIYGLSTSINHRHCLCARVELVSIASPDVISFHISLGEWVTGWNLWGRWLTWIMFGRWRLTWVRPAYFLPMLPTKIIMKSYEICMEYKLRNQGIIQFID